MSDRLHPSITTTTPELAAVIEAARHVLPLHPRLIQVLAQEDWPLATAVNVLYGELEQALRALDRANDPDWIVNEFFRKHQRNWEPPHLDWDE